jgi:hypothetical protein
VRLATKNCESTWTADQQNFNSRSQIGRCSYALHLRSRLIRHLDLGRSDGFDFRRGRAVGVAVLAVGAERALHVNLQLGKPAVADPEFQ